MYDWRAEDGLSLRGHCQHFSRLGWALLVQMASMLAVQCLAIFPAMFLAPWAMEDGTFLWCISTLSAYGVGFPLFCVVIRGVEGTPPVRRRPLGPLAFLQVLVICLGLMYLANYVTLALTGLIGLVRGAPVENPVESLTGYPVALNLLLGGVIAPLAEEIMFRKLLLDRLRPYGEGFAMGASALCFGLFHGNLNQYLYAFVIGLVLAYVVLKTGRLWQTVLLHALLNLTSVGLVPLLAEWALGLLVFGSIGLGLVFLIVRRREISFERGTMSLTEGRKWRLFFENPGVACFCLLSIGLAATYLL